MLSNHVSCFLRQGLAFAACLCLFSPPAGGQEEKAAEPKYDVLPIPAALQDYDPETEPDKEKVASKNQKDLMRHVSNIRRNGGVDDNFKLAFEKYLIPKMTRTEPRHLAELAQARLDLLKLIQSTRNEAVHDHLVTKIIFPQMQILAKGNFHPATRYNAMLIIGQLNSREAVTTGLSKNSPVPMAEALTEMIATMNDAQQIDAVKIAAMIGILRHVELDTQKQTEAERLINDETRTAIVNAIRKIATNEKPPQGRTVEGHTWMQRRALEILSLMSVVGDDRSVAAALKAVADNNAPVSLRCTAARALGNFRYSTEAGRVNPSDVVHKLGELAVFFCNHELDFIDSRRMSEEKRKQIESIAKQGGGGGFSGGGGIEGGGIEGGGIEGGGIAGAGGGGGRSSASKSKQTGEAYRVELTRRRLKYELGCVSSSLTAIQQKVEAMQKDPKEDGEKLTAALKKMEPVIVEINNLLQVTDMGLDLGDNDVSVEPVDLDTFADAIDKSAARLAAKLEDAFGKSTDSDPDADVPDEPDGPAVDGPAAAPADDSP